MEVQMDQNAPSRQIAVYGHETQAKLMAMRVYIHGLGGVGIEVAKNLILAGPKAVTLFDVSIVSEDDLARNFFCSQADVGKTTRAVASLPSLKQLNPNVHVAVGDSQDIDFISTNFNCVVLLDNYDKDYLIRLNKACHANKVGFLLGGSLGLYGYTFVDFGEDHRVFDPTGEEPRTIHISGITQEEQATVCLHEDKRHGLCDGDSVVFKAVEGMHQINNRSYKIKVKSPDSFTIGDTRTFSPYVNGGLALQQKTPIHFKSYDLEKSLRYPYPPESKEIPIANWQKFGVPQQLHIILNGVYTFYGKHHTLPYAQEHTLELVQIVKDSLHNRMEVEGEDFKIEAVDEKLIVNVAKYSHCQISPCSSFWGGIITQEIVKLTGKYTPLRQWLHHQFFEVLPTELPQQSKAKNDYAQIFGDAFVKRLSQCRTFMVGAGALGCEFIKMFALMGLGTEGKVTVTDDDNIQISNLNRQFLFRKEHIGKNKSVTACGVGQRMNPNCKFQPVSLRVGQENEQIFHDDFWTGLDLVVNAVDNVKARQYIDMQCVWFEKPLFESGTLGTKCHSQIIIPHSTISYTDITDPPEVSIPLCTLKNFPYQIEHTIQWARDYFEGAFAQPSAQLNSFYEYGVQFLKNLMKQNRQNPTTLKGKLQSIKKLYLANEKKSYQDCVEMGTLMFQSVFYNQIANLLAAFPADHIIETTKKPFWSGLKKPPCPLVLRLDDPLHVGFIQAAANIFATMFKIPMVKDVELVKNAISKVHVPQYVPQKVHVETDEKEEKKPVTIIDENDENDCKSLFDELSALKVSKDNANIPIEFEKDDPTNFHIEFMGGVSNLRARNYKIEEVDNFKVKLIAGKIIPAIITTTAMVVGVVGIEIIKYLLQGNKAAFKNCTINLALPLWVFNDPTPAITFKDKQYDEIMCGPIKVVPGEFNKWQKIDVKGPMTVKQLKDHFEEKYNVNVSMIAFGTASVYAGHLKDSKAREQMNVVQAIEHVTKKPLSKYKKFIPLGINCTLKDGSDCIMPDCKYQVY